MTGCNRRPNIAAVCNQQQSSTTRLVTAVTKYSTLLVSYKLCLTKGRGQYDKEQSQAEVVLMSN